MTTTDALRETLDSEPSVALAVLFGSTARGVSGSASDVDVGVLGLSATRLSQVRAFPGPGAQWQVSTAGGLHPRWRGDGRELHYLATDGKLMAVPIAGVGILEPGAPVALFQTRLSGTDPEGAAGYDIARDGRFLIVTPLEEAVSSITIIQNWKPPRP